MSVYVIGLNGKLETNPDILKPAVHKKIEVLEFDRPGSLGG